MNKIIMLINEGWYIKIAHQPKRMEVDGHRNWTVRVCWEAEKHGVKLESEWEGFELAEDAVEDLIEKCSSVY